MSDTPLIYDWSGAPVAAAYAPVTGRPNQAINTTAQGGILTLGVDAGGVARSPRVDANGSQYVVPTNPAGSAAQVYSAQLAPAAGSQYGMARQDSPAPSTYYPMNLDMQMSLNVHHKSKPTFRAIAPGVSCAANKSLVSLIYASTGTMVLRLNECVIYVPPGGGSGSLLGSSSVTYYPIICELRRITAATGGTSITPVSGDTADILATGVTVSSGATAGTTVNTFHRQDAVVTTGTGLPWYGRGDQNEKTYLIRPGEGFTVTCVSTGTINAASGSGTTTASVDVEMTFTQAVA